VQLAGELLLQTLHRLMVKACDAPEQMDSIRRRVKDVARARKVSARSHTREDCGTIAVGIEEHVPNPVVGFENRRQEPDWHSTLDSSH
jgi:hypothetical protein